MRLEEDIKLDYKDVLIRPKRSVLGSRKEVDLKRGFTFRNYKSLNAEKNFYEEEVHYRGIPIMESNTEHKISKIYNNLAVKIKSNYFK